MIIGKEVTNYDLAEKLIPIATVNRGLEDDPVVSKKTKTKMFELAEETCYRYNHFVANDNRTHPQFFYVPNSSSEPLP